MKIAKIFHHTAIAEAWSYLLLLGIAMPLKYFADWPFAVRWIGLAHGILFVAYCLLLAYFFLRRNFSFKLALWGFIAAWLPGGPFFFDKHIKRLYQNHP